MKFTQFLVVFFIAQLAVLPICSKASQHNLNSPDNLVADYLPWVPQYLTGTVSVALDFIDLYWNYTGQFPEQFRDIQEEGTLGYEYPRVAQLDLVDFNNWLDEMQLSFGYSNEIEIGRHSVSALLYEIQWAANPLDALDRLLRIDPYNDGFGNDNPIELVADVKEGLKLEIIDIVDDKKKPDYLNDLEAMIKTICDKATIDKNGFVLIPDDLKGTKTTIGCNCLKSLANSQNYWRLIGHEFKLKPVNPGLESPYTGYTEEEDKINGIGKFIPLEPDVFGPIAPGVPLSEGIVVVSLSGSEVDFGFIDRWGRPHIYPLWRILAHELCGHAVFFNKGMEVNPPGPQFSDKRGKRPHHDQAIKAENAIISEHPGQIKRGLWADFPNKPVTGTNAGGESFIVPKLTPRIK